MAKPYDWGPQIDVTGYCFLEEKAAKRYSPTQDLYTFLAAGPAPIYLGTVQDPPMPVKTIGVIYLPEVKEFQDALLNQVPHMRYLSLRGVAASCWNVNGVFAGFGSMILKDKQEVESIILRAFDETGLRVLLSKGWAKLGEDLKLPSNVFRLGNVPHSWLFPQCTAVIHHGGAGSTAAGLHNKEGKS